MWRGDGQWASTISLLDQVIVSASSLVVGVLLARWLTAEGYGAFTMAQAGVIFLSGTYNALIIEPMTVFGAGRFGGVSRSYFACMLAIHGVLSVGLVVVLGTLWGADRWGGSADWLGEAVLGVGVATPPLLLLWLWRRRLHVDGSPAGALVASGAYGACLLILVTAMRALDWLTVASALVAIGLASLVGCAAGMMWVEGGRSRDDAGRLPVPWRTVVGEHWNYGRWAVLASILYWAMGYLYYYLIGLFVGVAEVAALRVAVMLFQPVQTLQSGLASTYLPRATRTYVERGNVALDRRVFKVATVFTIVSVLYAVMVLLAGERLMTAVYGARYAGSFLYVPMLAAVTVAGSLGESYCLGLRALEASRDVFLAYGVGAVFTVAVGTVAVMLLGAAGAPAALLGSTLAFSGAAWALYRRRIVLGGSRRPVPLVR